MNFLKQITPDIKAIIWHRTNPVPDECQLALDYLTNGLISKNKKEGINLFVSSNLYIAEVTKKEQIHDIKESLPKGKTILISSEDMNDFSDKYVILNSNEIYL